MRLPRSIRWRLQLWYGLILVLVLGGFGFTAYQLERNRQFRRIDDELQRRVGILVSHLQPPRPHGPNDGGRSLGFLPPDRLPEDHPPEFQRDRPLPVFHLAPEDAHFFGTNDPNGFYFKISRPGADGEKEIAQSDNYQGGQDSAITVRGTDTNQQVNPPGTLPGKPSNPALPMNFGDNRITEERLPSGESIEVGCSIAPELRELHRAALTLTAVGGLVLLIGLAGGWWIASRAIRPIADIGATAVKISAGDLSQRINVDETESELGKLAAVLNSTFARLETAFAQQKQFAADAAHELRTPVSVMLTQAQTALARERNAADYRETLEACQRAAQRMRRLIGSLLELARFDAGQEVLRRARFDLSRVAAEGVELVKPLADERRIKIIADLPPLEITGDAERVSQVIANLLVNAIQYNRDGGEVRVSARRESGLAILSVADTGQGIAPEDLARVFDRFYRADKSRAGGGAGLGLSICKAIAEAHGGAIEAASQPGGGSTFTVRLPV
jgi:heavy metal sensor kinase